MFKEALFLGLFSCGSLLLASENGNGSLLYHVFMDAKVLDEVVSFLPPKFEIRADTQFYDGIVIPPSDDDPNRETTYQDAIVKQLIRLSTTHTPLSYFYGNGFYECQFLKKGTIFRAYPKIPAILKSLNEQTI